MIAFKRTLLFTLLLCCTVCAMAQSKYAVRAGVYVGYNVPGTPVQEEIAKRPVMGGELAFEWLPQGNYPWQRWWNMPIIGVALQGIDMGNNAVWGQSFAVYPYLAIPLGNPKKTYFHFKMGLGLSVNTKTFNMTDTLGGIKSPLANSSIGSILNGFMLLGVDCVVPITKGFYFNANAGYNHMSNGNIFQPNAGFNIVFLTVGASYRFDHCPRCEKPLPPKESFPYNFAANVTIAAGTRELYYKDSKRYVIGSIHAGVTYQVAPFYAVGGGLDFFYDGAFNQQGYTSGMTKAEKAEQQMHTTYNRYYIENENFINKVRVGISLNNEFPISRVTILFDWGVYLYDPLKNAYTHKKENNINSVGILYKYDIQKEDGWNYFRLGLRCRLYDNLYAQVSVKTHLQKAEFIEFGLGYQFPFKKQNDKESLYHKSTKWELYHPDAKHKQIGRAHV